MKTTLDLDGALLREDKRRAAASGTTLRAFVEDALRSRMLPRPTRRARFRLDLPVVTGTGPPAVDISDRRALYDFMERRR